MFSSPFEIIQFIVGIFGAATTVMCFIPQGIKTFLSRDTSGLSKWFFICAITSSVFWFGIGSMTIAAPFVLQQGSISSGLSGGLPSIITNVITVTINTGILLIKLNNIKNAKKMNLTESEYCNKIKKDVVSNL